MAALLLLLDPGAAASARDVSSAAARQLGFSPERLRALDRFYEGRVARGELAGIVILIARHGKLAHLSAIGKADIESGRPMTPDSLFRVNSMTKPIAATALMMLYQEGRFQLGDPVSKYLPEFAGIRVLRTPTSALDDTVPARREPTIHDLLRHTAGLVNALGTSAVDREYARLGVYGLDVPLSEEVAKIARVPLLYQPGEQFYYSAASDVQARLVEVLSGMPFDRFLEQRLFGPLRMTDTGHRVEPARSARLATLYWPRAGRLTPLDAAHGGPDDPIFLERPEWVNGYTAEHRRKGDDFGLVSTAGDWWRFSQMILDRGVSDGKRIMSPHVVDYMIRDHLAPGQNKGKAFIGFDGVGWGLGFAVVKDAAAAEFVGGEGTAFWMGGANTYFWIDPGADMVVVAMTQHMRISLPLTQELHALVYSALEEPSDVPPHLRRVALSPHSAR